VSPIKFKQLLEKKMKQLSLHPAFAERSLNQGFSGGEKKKAEILQLLMLQPTLALLDETDSGLDIDALRIVAEGVSSLRGPEFTSLVVTHYARLLHHIVPDKVHVMVNGSIVESGGPELAERLEREGYMRYGIQEAS
jgi:Fe-S cluster assembly ATP-binding protein